MKEEHFMKESHFTGESRCFQKALSDFTYETAIGGAIRHLTDSGYTVRQIMEQLDFPASYERVQKAVWEHLLRQGTILLEPPGKCRPKEKVTYVREYDSYGKASFRRVVQEETEGTAEWVVQALDSNGSFLENGISADEAFPNAYVSFDFGLMSRKDPAQYEAMLSVLDMCQKEYVIGLPWENRRVYHKLDAHGKEILMQLSQAGVYHGECYFCKK